MKPVLSDDRLSRITTVWTMVLQAHGQPLDAALAAQQQLVQRYSSAVYAYLLGALRDREAADELFQEFALRVVRGDFFRADRERGRFRDYLRKALVNLVNDHFRVRQAWPRAFSSGEGELTLAPVLDDERSFLDSWREELLERTWRALATAHPTYHAVLLFRVLNPDVPSPRMAEELSRQLEKPLTADSVRKALQRAQGKFADLLVEEVAISLGQPETRELEQELRELDLLKYCRPALERRRSH